MEQEKERVFVAGHKNPDMDCTCAAYCYAALKQTTDPTREYIPIRSGPLSEQIRSVFEQASCEVPGHYDTIAPSVGLVARKSPSLIRTDDPVLEVFNAVKIKTISSIPVFDQEDTFQGMVGINEITSWVVEQNQGLRPMYTFLIRNFDHVLPGSIIHQGTQDRFEAPIVTISMPVPVALKRLEDMQAPPVVVVGNVPEIIRFAVDQQYPAIVLTGLTSADEVSVDFTNYTGTVYLSSTDSAESIRLLRLGTPVYTIMDREVPRLQANMPFDAAKSQLISSTYRGLPVFSGDEFLGVVSRRSFIERPRPKLIMVDHNEISQAVDGADQAEILEILDHHRLAPPSTSQPIAVTTRVVGSSCTLIYEEFINRGLAISKEIALLLLSGIVSDTVNLQSPTTTESDRRAMLRLETITGVSAAEHAQQLFSQLKALSSREPREIILSDFKRYDHQGVHFGIGQVEVTTLEDTESFRERLIAALETVAREYRLDWTMILVTDVIKRNSLLLSNDFSAGEQNLPFREIVDGTFDLPGVLSRKKQLLPEIIRVISEIAVGEVAN